MSRGPAERAKNSRSNPALGKAKIIAFAATTNSAKTKAFYRDKLGLRLVSEDRFALVFDLGGTTLRVQRVEKATISPYTSLGWAVKGVATKVKQLVAAGVVFERYETLQQDELGIWTSPSGAKVAWFKEPEGNTFSLTEFEGN